ncbi:hypothetical protein chiPu_0018749 [Chiloscyllium punctatum]|uniref:Uncharacterized protein n=1 Tax=Chiloscyllium punctatum TaxID=137246 RepID=A0A401RPK6_CHIPU|nr:hypothetical protein [Chiloscyllium punctatum]
MTAAESRVWCVSHKTGAEESLARPSPDTHTHTTSSGRRAQASSRVPAVGPDLDTGPDLLGFHQQQDEKAPPQPQDAKAGCVCEYKRVRLLTGPRSPTSQPLHTPRLSELRTVLSAIFLARRRINRAPSADRHRLGRRPRDPPHSAHARSSSGKGDNRRRWRHRGPVSRSPFSSGCVPPPLRAAAGAPRKETRLRPDYTGLQHRRIFSLTGPPGQILPDLLSFSGHFWFCY